VLALTTQTEVGGERLKLALAQPTASLRVLAQLPREAPSNGKDAETSALQAQVRSLSADRERLATRLTSIERHLDDLTGSIQRQVAPPSSPSPRARQPEPAPVASVTPAAPTPRRSASAPPSVPALPEKTQIALLASAIINPLAMPPGSEGTGSWPEPEAPAMAAPPLTESREIVPLPPTRLAAVPPKTAQTSLQRVPLRYEYGIELAVAADLEALRTRWAAVKANYGPMLAGLQPIALRDPRPGVTHVRLVAGPLPNLTAARQSCARLAAARAACRPARFTADAVVQQ